MLFAEIIWLLGYVKSKDWKNMSLHLEEVAYLATSSFVINDILYVEI